MTREEHMELGPTDAFVARSDSRTFGSPGEHLEWIYERRIDDRADPSSVAWLNDLIKNGAREHDHIRNGMHLALLGQELSEEQMARFLDAYYLGSNYGFNRMVLPETLHRSRNELYRRYIKAIIKEEMTPSSHWGIFQRFMDDLGFPVSDEMPASAEAFVAKNRAGYQADLGHAVGYALAVEVESDFQLSMLAVALMARYPEQMRRTEFFDIHLDPTGEEQHARQTCETIEKMIDAGEYQRGDIEVGFHQAIIDTRDFMEEMLREVRGPAYVG